MANVMISPMTDSGEWLYLSQTKEIEFKDILCHCRYCVGRYGHCLELGMNVYHHKKKCLVIDAIAKILFTEIHYGFIQSDNSS